MSAPKSASVASSTAVERWESMDARSAGESHEASGRRGPVPVAREARGERDADEEERQVEESAACRGEELAEESFEKGCREAFSRVTEIEERTAAEEILRKRETRTQGGAGRSENRTPARGGSPLFTF